MKRQWQPKIRVYCDTCEDWIDEEKTKFINIEEDIQGRDLLTFKCPECKKVSKSLRIG